MRSLELDGPTVGIGLRRPHFEDVLKTTRRIDRLEFVPENFIGFGGRSVRVLEACRERWPLIAHGVTSNLGGVDPIVPEWVDTLRRFLDEVDAPCFSDHACFTAHRGIESLDLLPLPFTEASAEHLGERARALAERLERPLLLENVTFYAQMPGATMSEGAWLQRLVEVSGAKLLLDLNNVYVNARNHGWDLDEVWSGLPWAHVERVHLAGHGERDGVLLDSHAGPVSDPVLALYLRLVREHGPVETILEWDNAIPPLDEVLDEADRVREAATAALQEGRLARATPPADARPYELAHSGVPLSTYFETMGTFLTRQRDDLDAVLAAVGPSPSGRARVELYVSLVDNQAFAALENFFASTRRALEVHRKGAFREACRRGLAEGRCTGRHPSRLAPGFAAGVASWVDDPPPWLEELADLEYTVFRMHSEPRPRPEVRWYGHDVYAFSRGRGGKVPVERPQGLIFARTGPPGHHRGPGPDRFVAQDATPLRVAALGLATGELTLAEAEAMVGADEAAISSARVELLEVGVLDHLPA